MNIGKIKILLPKLRNPKDSVGNNLNVGNGFGNKEFIPPANSHREAMFMSNTLNQEIK